MTWFKVDDSFHSHPKVLATSPAALGLWVVAGAWCGANLTDGFVPDYVLPRLLPDSGSLADQLVSTGLWKRAKGGYRFHDWLSYNPSAKIVYSEREAARDRMRSLRETRRGKHVRPDQTEKRSPEQTPNVQPNNTRTFGVRSPSPTRPVPKGRDEVEVGEERGTYVTHAKQDPEPSPQCEDHQGNPNPPPCGACADARRAYERWAADRRRRLDAAPKCRTHQGQLADNCSGCRSDAIAAQTGQFPIVTPTHNPQ